MLTATNATNAPLAKSLRTQLENVVKTARDVAEKAAKSVLVQLATGDVKAPDYLDDDQKALRRRLRAHGRALGDVKHKDETQDLQHLIWEVAYEHWHRMLFARFLAENGLLMWEPDAAVTLDDCRDMVDNHPDMAMGAKSHWELAAKLAARMLPQVFKPQSPVFELTFAPEHQRELEKLLARLHEQVFKASDSLGWVYQFWQSKRKDEVNESGAKIGADELPSVTQLFTEPYMVEFLLHNSLGAWWKAKYPGKNCPVELTYLREFGDSSPAAGSFEGWPDSLTEFKLLDPCCGSGHFLVAAFLLLVPMRIAAERLSAKDAVDAVVSQNLHGLELDPRCVEIAVFAIALAAWRFPDENGNPLGVRADMPAPNIACSGLKVAAQPGTWEALVADSALNATVLRQELRLLHANFQQAPLLGSLLDPTRSISNDLASGGFETLVDLLGTALDKESLNNAANNDANEVEESWDLAVSAQGLAKAAQIMSERYNLVITNVPYLARGRQSEPLRAFCESHYKEAKNDLANVFLARCLELVHSDGAGVVQIVMPQNWLVLTSYKRQRETLLNDVSWNLLARLGEGGFDSPQAAGAFIILLTQTRQRPDAGFNLRAIDAALPKTPSEKANVLKDGAVTEVNQAQLLAGPDSRVLLEESTGGPLLSAYAEALVGLQTSDDPMFTLGFWEVPKIDRDVWELLQATPERFETVDGQSWIVRWERGEGLLLSLPTAYPTKGLKAVGRPGIAIHRMRKLFAYRFGKERFHQNVAVILPKDDQHLAAIWCFCRSPQFNEAVRAIDHTLKVTNATLVKVPFDLGHWRQVAAEQYAEGLPAPYSDDPTQWIFHGHPLPAENPLQVAVARLLGHKWPAETDQEMEISLEARQSIAYAQLLRKHVDDDGIVCLGAVRGEKPAHERLLSLLIDAWETVKPGSWKSSVLDKLLNDADCAGKALEVWLRDQFFEQHVACFHGRPFIWHVWDGLKDGFGALVNYHKLDAKNLERLIHTYLGDWIRTQEVGAADGVDGAPERLAAAQILKRKLEAILEGEAPYDIFVRWKDLEQQPMGWHPDLNDGVRLNIRPFMTAEVLRHNKKPKLNITWEKDRGKDVETAPWFNVFKGERINDHHSTLEEKRMAKGKKA
jgi:hypothetical protein